jgi:hypothetical protein
MEESRYLFSMVASFLNNCDCNILGFDKPFGSSPWR